MKQCSPVVFIGLDSADPALLLKWEKEGLLPTLSSLRRRSLRGEAILPSGLGTGAMWVSLYSGVSPARHGRYFGRQIEDDAYRVAPFRPNAVKQEPVWVAASRANKRVAVIDIPVAPLAENLNGIQIKDWGAHDPVSPRVQTCPPSLAEEVTARYGTDAVGSCDRPRKGAGAYKEFRDRLIERVEKKGQLICDHLQTGGWDLFMAGFGDSHCVAHQAWHLHDPGHPLHDPEFAKTFGDPVQDVYIALDRAVGRILECVSPATTFILFSGSGMGPNYTGNHLLDEALRRLEGIPATQEHRAIQAVKQVYRRVLPDNVRSWLGPLGDRVDELSLAGDRARRMFYSLPHNDLSGAIRFNVVGREPNGRVKRGDEYDALCVALRRDLMELRNPDTGKPAVTDVLKTSDLYSGKYLDELPDLLVLWNRDQAITAIASEKTGEIRGVRMSKRTGDHVHTGAFFASGPGIDAGDLAQPVPVESFAPTIAALLGVALPDVDGAAIPAICGSGDSYQPKLGFSDV
jgi:predicted AlkP superfamily phosphohydrolase/phosphomutase